MPPARAAAEPGETGSYDVGVGTLRELLRSGRLLRPVALAQLVANVVIVVTGGAVRLSGSGLGCPTWPRCTGNSYVTTPAMGWHGRIEFGNRTLTGAVGVLAVACVLLALAEQSRSRRRIWLAVLTFAQIPAQAVLGGITVRTHLNPWAVACHFLLSMLVIALAYQLYVASGEADGPRSLLVRPPLHALAWLTVGLSGAVLVAGAIVTGSGPHAGDEKAKRTGLDPGMVAQLHTDLVMLLIGVSVALWFALRATSAPRDTQRAAVVLIAVELAQGTIGFVQYFTHLPVLLVGLHMAGACVVWVASLAVLSASRTRQVPVAAPTVAPAAQLADATA
jgi:cytochrome c oxidase assembly protein subunit 15